MSAARRRVAVPDPRLAADIGARLRAARLRAGLTQQQLAEGRYTKAYVSALEKGHARPSMTALAFLSERLGVAPSHLLGDIASTSTLEARLHVASGRWEAVEQASTSLLHGPLDRVSRARVLLDLAQARVRNGRPGEAIEPADEAIELFVAASRPRDGLEARAWAAMARAASGERGRARAMLSELAKELRSDHDADPDLAVQVQGALAELVAADGDADEAMRLLEAAVDDARAVSDARRVERHVTLARTAQAEGDPTLAATHADAAAAVAAAARARNERIELELSLAEAYLASGRDDEAGELAARARAAGADPATAARAADVAARVALARGATDDAVRAAAEAVEAAAAAGTTEAVALAMATQARTLAASDPQRAMATFEDAAERLRADGRASSLKEVLGAWAELAATLGRHEQAYALSREALVAEGRPPGPARGASRQRPRP